MSELLLEEARETRIKKYRTVTQTSYLIVPFALKKSENYETAINRLLSATYTNRAGKKEKLWEPKNFSRQRLFAHVSKLIDRNSARSNESIGTRLVFKDAARSSQNLPNKQKLTFTPDKEKFTFSLGNMELYLFETLVGFVVIDIKYLDGEILDEIIKCNYYLKKCYQYKNDLRFIKTTGKNQQKEINVSFCDLINKLLTGIEVETFFEEILKEEVGREEADNNEKERKVQKFASYAIVFSSALLGSEYKMDKALQSQQQEGSDNEQLLKYLFQMRRSFKENYAAAPQEYELENNDEIIQLFENSFWGVSLEGAAHIAYLQNDDSDTFFKETHASNVREVYFYLFIIALHQYYALHYFSILASRLPATLEDYMKNKSGAQKDMEELKARMVFFSLRCAFKQVSHISHQTSLYEMFRRVLRIEELMDELNLEIEAISSITEMEKSRRNKNIENLILCLTTIFVIISTINDSMGVITFVDISNWPAHKTYTPWIAGLLWPLIGFCSIYLVLKLLSLLRK